MRIVPAWLLALAAALVFGPWLAIVATDSWFTPIGSSDTATWGDLVALGAILPFSAVVLWAGRPVVSALGRSSAMGRALWFLAIGLGFWTIQEIVSTVERVLSDAAIEAGSITLAIALVATYGTVVWGTIQLGVAASHGIIDHPGRWIALRVAIAAPLIGIASILLITEVGGAPLEPIDYVYLTGDSVAVVAAFVAWRRLGAWRGGLLVGPITYLVVAGPCYLLGEVCYYLWSAGVAESVTYPLVFGLQLAAPALIAMMFVELRARLVPSS
jgi:hypothetical protein